MNSYKQSNRPEVLKIRADMIKKVGFAFLLAGLTPVFAGIMGDFGTNDPMLVFWFVIGALSLGVIILFLSYLCYVKADKELFKIEQQNSN
tara:strand:- start:173 stop:442 length:270 start_codon:yes stop_codon:yes gene_type:complete